MSGHWFSLFLRLVLRVGRRRGTICHRRSPRWEIWTKAFLTKSGGLDFVWTRKASPTMAEDEIILTGNNLLMSFLLNLFIVWLTGNITLWKSFADRLSAPVAVIRRRWEPIPVIYDYPFFLNYVHKSKRLTMGCRLGEPWLTRLPSDRAFLRPRNRNTHLL